MNEDLKIVIKADVDNARRQLDEVAEGLKEIRDESAKAASSLNNLSNSTANANASLGDGKSQQNINDTNEAVISLRESMESIRNLSFIDILLEAFNSEKIAEQIDSIKWLFDDWAISMEYGFGSLFPDSSYYQETGAEWEGLLGGIGNMFFFLGDAAASAWTAIKLLFEAIGTALKGILGVLLVVIGNLLIMIGLFKNALNIAKEIKTMAAEASKIGMETHTYEEWGYVLKQVGVEADKLTDFIKTLSDEQNAVREGSEDMIKAFNAIGLSAEEVRNSSQEELFQKTVEGLQNVENASERTSIAYKIFGEDAADLANILYLNNQEVQSLINNYNNLGASPSENLIKQSKVLEGSTTNLSYAWQGLKNTLAEWVMPVVIKIVQWITIAVAYINAFLQGVFGIELGTDKAAKGTENISKGLKDSRDNAEKLKRTLMGFDELNVVSDPNSSSSSSTSSFNDYSGAGINPELPVIEIPDMTAFKEFMAEYGSIIQGILTWSLIGIGVLMTVLGFMSGNIPMALIGISLAGLGIAVGAAGGEDSHWNKLGEGIMSVLSAIGQFFVDCWNGIVSVWNGAGEWFAGVWEAITIAFANTGEWFAKKFSDAWDWTVEAWNGAGEWFGGVWTDISNAFSATGDWFSKKFSDAWEGTKSSWKSAGEWFSGVWDSITKAFSAVYTWFRTMFNRGWLAIKNAFAPVGEFFEGVWTKIKNIFGKVGDTIGNAVSNAFSSAINWVLEKAIGIINGFIKAINIAISVINAIPGVSISTIDELDVPKLAKGGITNGATAAIIGEAGKEAVLPLENNTEWIDMLAERLNRNNAPSKIVLMLDGKELGWATVKSLSDLYKQTGDLPIVLA